MRSPVGNWIRSSDYDFKTAEHMLATGRYVYVLFFCHLAVEKILKGLYEAAVGKIPPKTHNLVFLLNAARVEIPEDHLRTIEELNDLSIVTRYPEDIDAIVRAFRKKRVADHLERTRELLKWLRKLPQLKR